MSCDKNRITVTYESREANTENYFLLKLQLIRSKRSRFILYEFICYFSCSEPVDLFVKWQWLHNNLVRSLLHFHLWTASSLFMEIAARFVYLVCKYADLCIERIYTCYIRECRVWRDLQQTTSINPQPPGLAFG